MKKRNYLICCFFVFFICSCSTNKIQRSGTDPLISKGSYRFMMMDSIKNKLAEGNMIVVENSNNIIKGNYTFEKVYTEFPGYSSMKGIFEGSVDPGSMSLLINTNPIIADDNVFFNMNLGEDTLKGIWYYSAFRQQDITGEIFILKK